MVVAALTWVAAGEPPLEIARTITDERGSFEVSWSPSLQQSHVAVVALDHNSNVAATVEVDLSRGGARPLRLVVSSPKSAATVPAASGGSPESGDVDTPSIYEVSGTVSCPSSAAVNGLIVQIVDKNVGGDVSLGTGRTDAIGRYEVRVELSAATLESRNKASPDLQTQVLLGETVLASSIVRYDASPKEVLNVVLADSTSLPSEYEALTAALGSIYKGPLADLVESETRQDITYLSNKSGWDARAVAMASLAARYSQQAVTSGEDGTAASVTAAGKAPTPDQAEPSREDSPTTATMSDSNARGAGAADVTSVDPAFYYALLRAGMPADINVIHQLPSSSVASIWEQAAANNVIPPNLASQITASKQSFEAAAVSRALTAPPIVGPSTVGELLQVTLGSAQPSEQTQFAELLVKYGNDPKTLWSQTESVLGTSTAAQLQLLGQLSYLTANNAALITNLFEAYADQQLSAPSDLVKSGLYEESAWLSLLANVEVPAEFSSTDEATTKVSYAGYLAAQVRLAYPTLTISHMAATGAFGEDITSDAATWLAENPRFDIGSDRIRQYLAANNLSATDDVVSQIQSLQRVYQITPSNAAMAALLSRGIDSAYAVTKHLQRDFVSAFGDAVGSDEVASSIYNRAQVITASTTHVAMSYLTGRKQPALGSGVISSLVGGSSAGESSAGESSGTPTGAQATLEDLFGNLDYCQCDDCQSITSASAYLVDLLDWINVTPSSGGSNPKDVLLTRRPDIGALQLTCSNTNTALPYVDLANEVLEYFVGNTTAPESLSDFVGYNDDGAISSAELTASPQNDSNTVAEHAYQLLKAQFYPSPLPFYRDLELLRLHVARFGITLYELMVAMRTSESLNAGPGAYAWKDILLERLGLSPPECQLLTDSVSVPLAELLGTGSISTLSSLQEFSRRAGVAYTDIVSILQCSFVNPGSWLVPLLEALNLPYASLEAVNSGAMSSATLASALPPNLTYGDYGATGVTGVEAWVKANFAKIQPLLVIDVGQDSCDTSAMKLNHLDGTPLVEAEFVRLARFIRLWQKLDLTVQQTNTLINAFYKPSLPASANLLQQLDSGLSNVLPSAGIAYRAMDLLGLDASTDLDSLLICWCPFTDVGPGSLYARMFLNPTVLSLDPTFAPDASGELFSTSPTLLDHQPAILAALNLTAGEFELITGPAPLGLGYDNTTPLSLGAISEVFRRAWLARTLSLSVLELLSLRAFTGVDPFGPPVLSSGQPVFSPLLDFVERAQALGTAGVTPVQVLYLLWNIDLSGVSAPSTNVTTGLAGSLRSAFIAINNQFSAGGNVTAATAKSLMAQVLGATAADQYFALINQTYVTSVSFGYSSATLPSAVLTIGGKQLSYDDLSKQLSFSGYLTATMLAALQATASGDALLLGGLNNLASANAQAVQTFFATYDDPHLPYLQPLFDTYMSATSGPASGDPSSALTTLLNGLLPVLGDLRKQEQALACATTQAGCDSSFAPALLNSPAAISAANPSAVTATDPTPAGVVDLTALDTGGLSVQFFLSNDPSAAADQSDTVAPSLTYDASNPLPSPKSPSTAIAATWSGYLRADQDGDYNINFSVDPGAIVTLTVDDQDVPLIHSDSPGNRVWANQYAMSLRAGQLTPIRIGATGLSDTFSANWQTLGTGWQPIPAESLFSDVLLGYLQETLLRFLKATSLASDLSLDAAEIVYLATSAGLTVGVNGWLETMRVGPPLDPLAPASPPTADPAPASSYADLVVVTDTLLAYAALKAQYSPSSAQTPQLLTTLADLSAGSPAAASELLALTGWDPASLQPLLTRLFNLPVMGTPPSPDPVAAFGALPGIVLNLARLRSAYSIVSTCGLSASTLVEAATNDPAPTPVPPGSPQVLSDFQSAVRSRYDESDWLSVIQPINDSIREMQRDALVAYVLAESGDTILETLGITPSPNRVPTPDDLYNYFLLDVEMESCMQTSRIRLALSSVQLFIERCLRNLEPTVNPGDIVSTQWEWRSRYRVWQANREVFLWPENWLDPSLRDDQSPFFETLLSQLLQGDVTDDAAVETYLDYLSNLEGVAKLEPCGLYVDEDSGITHVVARNGGAHRKYFYRRFDGVSWSPWEDMKLSIEDLPVVPYVWNGRLLVFWLQLHYQSNSSVTEIGNSLPTDPSSTPLEKATITGLSTSVANAAPGLTAQQVSAVLCFSEYYNGSWQPVKTSDINTPVLLQQSLQGQIDRATVFLRPWSSTNESDETLYVQIGTNDSLQAFQGAPPREPHRRSAPGVRHIAARVWGLIGWDITGFAVHNTHSPPVSFALIPPTEVQMPTYFRELQTSSSNEFKSIYGRIETDQVSPVDSATIEVLTGELPQTIVPAQPDVVDQTPLPFFFGDARSVFYVTSRLVYPELATFRGFGIRPVAIASVSIPQMVVPTGPMQPDLPISIAATNVTRAAAAATVASGELRSAIDGGTNVSYGDRSVGITGSTSTPSDPETSRTSSAADAERLA